MDFGATLRQAREHRGISLRQISTATKISMPALEALEKNDIARLPGGIFTRAFVRSYAAEVGLDPEQTVQEFLAQFPLEGVADGSPYSNNSQENDVFQSQQRMASTLLRLVLWSLTAAALIIYLTVGGREADVPPPEPGTGEELVEPSAAPRPPSPDGGVPGRGEAEPTSAAPLIVGTAATRPLTIDIHPQGRCWVSLTLDGEPVFARVMQAGEREIGEAEREITLSVGDAGAFAFAINHQPGRPLGERGEVVTARINRENYRNFVTQ